MYLNFEKEMDPSNLKHIRFTDPKVHAKYVEFKLKKIRENWQDLKWPLQFLCVMVATVEYFYNEVENRENYISFIGAVTLFSLVEFFYRTIPHSEFIARYAGVVLFCSFSVYMAEINV